MATERDMVKKYAQKPLSNTDAQCLDIMGNVNDAPSYQISERDEEIAKKKNFIYSQCPSANEKYWIII